MSILDGGGAQVPPIDEPPLLVIQIGIVTLGKLICFQQLAAMIKQGWIKFNFNLTSTGLWATHP